MNELLAPLYYVLAHDPSLSQDFPKSMEEREKAAEADTFWCFQALMTHVSELYVCPSFFFFSSWLFSFEQYEQRQQQHVRYTRELDTGCAGISGCIKRFEKTLSNADVELATHLARQGVRSEFYAFRWLVTLNSREFELPEVRIYSPPSFWSDNNNNTKLRYWDFGMQSFPIGDTFVRTDLYTIFVQPC